MDESSVLESMENDEEVKKVSVVGKLGNVGEYKVDKNGSREVKNIDDNGLLSDVIGTGAEFFGPLSPAPVQMKAEVSPSPTKTKKGYGLKKWRRIKRDVNKGGSSGGDTDKIMIQELSEPVMNLSKRTHAYAEKQKKIDGSVSSKNHMVGSLDIFSLLGDSEDRSSESSTEASIPKEKYETSVGMGFPHDKIRARSLTGKNFSRSARHGQHGKGWVEAKKKGTYTTSNGIQSDGPVRYDGENGDKVKVSQQEVSSGLQGSYSRDNEGGYDHISCEDAAADSYNGVKKERNENNGSSSDQDSLVESIAVLQSAQEALQKEVVKFKEIGNDASVDDSVSDANHEFAVEQKLQETSSERFPSSEGAQGVSQAAQSEVVETEKKDVETEIEDLYKQKVEAEVEYLAISRTVQNLRAAAVDQMTVFEEQKAPVSEQTQIVDKLGDEENEAAILKKEAEKLEKSPEDIASVDEMLKLQKRVSKYTSYFFVQLLSLLVLVGIFIYRLSPNYVDVVPT